MLSNQILNHKFYLLGEGKTVENSTGEELVEAFRKTVDIRDQMCGAMFYGILNEECHMLYDARRFKGVDETIMSELFGYLR